MDEDGNVVRAWLGVRLDLSGVDYVLAEGVYAVVTGMRLGDRISVTHVYTGRANPKYMGRDSFEDNKNVRMVVAAGPFVDETGKFSARQVTETINRMWEKAPDVAVLIGPIVALTDDVSEIKLEDNQWSA